MAKQIAKLLKATIQDSSDLKQIAKQLAKKGRGGDSMLVHITPREATMLKEAGGAGTINPDTGLMEFYDGDYKFSDYADFSSPDVSTGGYRTRAPAAVPSIDIDVPVVRELRGTNVPDFRGNQGSLSANIPKAEYDAQLRSAQINADYDRFQEIERDVNADFARRAQEDFSARSPYGVYGIRPGGVGLRTDPGQLMQGTYGLVPGAPALPDTSALTPTFRGATPTYSDELVQKALGREPTFTERLKAAATSPRTLETLGLAGISAIPGILQAQQARKQGQRAREEMQAMAAPYRERGAELTRQAQTGELSPAEQQQLQAMQARVAQGVAGRGGVGAEQAQVQLEAFRQQLLANKYDLGLKVSGIADQIATGAIKAGLEADQYVNELTSNYFSNAMQMAMMNMGQRPQGA
jgi:hypothetical protein